ncbi:MAG TPA: hypothetical protein VLZ83_14065 [Edaphocola sp.]|nr:hypothetical protein [Edaphocola sp.]
MSISELLDNVQHPWANLRINNLIVDGELIINGSSESENLKLPVIYGGNLWPSVQNKNILFTKTNNKVTMQLEAAKASSVGGTGREIIIDETIPFDFRPIVNIGGLYSMPIFGWLSGEYGSAELLIDQSGKITIQFKSTPVGINCGIDNCSFSWITS